MKLYYRAVSQDGKSVRGLIDARNIKEAADYLRKHDLIPIKIVQENGRGLAKYLPFLNQTKSGDLVFFTRQLSSMITSGLTLVQALNILRNQMQTQAMSEVVESIISDVEDGKLLSKSLEKHPKVFPAIYIALVKTAEASGLLDKVLSRLADNLEKKDKLHRTIRGALMYPAIVLVMMILVTIVMMIFVVPQLTTLYGNIDMSLPLATRFIIGLSDFTINYWYYAIMMGVLLFFYLRNWYHKPSGRKVVDKYILKMPVFGKLQVESMMAEFARTLSLLISSGALVVDSLNKSAEVMDNVLYKEAIMTVSKRVEKGISIGDSLAASPLFPQMMVEMVKIGEQTGKLDSSLLKASEYYEREVDESVKVMTTLIEPIVMVLLALGVGFLIISVITPIYNLISSIG